MTSCKYLSLKFPKVILQILLLIIFTTYLLLILSAADIKINDVDCCMSLHALLLLYNITAQSIPDTSHL